MPDQIDFDRRLAQALVRYAERAPKAQSTEDVARAAMGADPATARRWPYTVPAAASLALLLCLLLLAMLAVMSGAAGRFLQRDQGLVGPQPSTTASPAPTGPEVGAGETWIAYMATGSGRLIEVVRPDGTGRHTLFPAVPAGEQQHPDWSPDGGRLIFSLIQATGQVIWIGGCGRHAHVVVGRLPGPMPLGR